MFWYLLRRAAEKFCRSVVAEVKLPGAVEVKHAGQRDRATNRRLVGGESERELTSRGMPHHDEPIEFQRIAFCNLRNKPEAVGDVLECSGPAATGIAHPPIFQAPGRDTAGGESSANVPGMGEIILRAPEATVYENGNRMRAFAGGPAQVGELVRVSAIVQALGRRRWKAEDVFATQRFFDSERLM